MNIINSKKPFKDFVNKVRHKNGNLILLETSGIPVYNSKSEFCGYRGIGRDITERKNVEKEKQQKEKLTTVLEIVGATSHEFSQPLQILSGTAYLLLKNVPDNSPDKKKIETLKRQADRMGELTKKMQCITRYETKEYLEGRIIDFDKSSDIIDRGK